MNFFFDANISYRIANMMGALYEDVHKIVHITQHPDFSHNNVVGPSGRVLGNRTPDLEWMPALGGSGLDWKVISGDMDIVDSAHERAMVLEHRLTLFACDRHWAKHSASEQAWRIVKLWDEIVRHANTPGPAIFCIRAGRNLGVEVVRADGRARGGRRRS